jgi:hypothetical protein
MSGIFCENCIYSDTVDFFKKKRFLVPKHKMISNQQFILRDSEIVHIFQTRKNKQYINNNED